MVDRLERLINLVIALRETRRPLPAEDIRERVAGYGQPDADAFRRMFERDKSDLRDLGVPIETVPVDRFSEITGYRIDPRRYDLPEVRLEPAELAALALAVEAIGLEDAADAGLLKLAVDADDPGGADERGASDRPALGLEVGLRGPYLDDLTRAQLERTTVRFTYRAAGGDARVRTVDPHGLVHRRGWWYLVGHDHERGDRRAFRLDRISGRIRVVSQPGAFAPPADRVRVDEVVPPAPAGAPTQAEVLASPEVAWQVARRAVDAGRPQPDGWTAFTVTVGNPAILVGWLLEFGPDVEVREPPELRAAMVAALRAALAAVSG